MDDDEVFDRGMAALGVEPLDGSAPGQLAKERQRQRDESDDQLFLRVMHELDQRGHRDQRSRKEPRGAQPRVQRLKGRPKNLRIDDQIDLHGLRAEAALQRLDRFVTQATASGLRTILVITGKGHHSPGGRGILRQRVEEWIRGCRRARIRTWSEAPRHLGGRGAFVLYLRSAPD